MITMIMMKRMMMISILYLLTFDTNPLAIEINT